jgi:hypothetical protein
MSRYIERAENMARLLEVGYRIALLPREGGGEGDPGLAEPGTGATACWCSDWKRRTASGLSAMGKSKECQPLCKFCGERAKFSIGAECFDGSRIRFMIDHFACEACVKKSGSGFVERIR